MIKIIFPSRKRLARVASLVKSVSHLREERYRSFLQPFRKRRRGEVPARFEALIIFLPNQSYQKQRNLQSNIPHENVKILSQTVAHYSQLYVEGKLAVGGKPTCSRPLRGGPLRASPECWEEGQYCSWGWLLLL